MTDNEPSQAIVDFLIKALTYARNGGDLDALIGKANRNGVMVAFYLPSETWEILAPFSEIPPEELHLTLAYLGTIEEQETTFDQLVECLAQFAKDADPIFGALSGVARFYNVEEDGTNAVVALFDSSALPEWRQRLIEHMEWRNQGQIKVSRKHGFIPHITVRYVDQQTTVDSDSVITVPDARIVFYDLYLTWGDRRIPFKLQGMTKETVEALLNEGPDNA